jgi:polysaccharide pyruvyl transferase WcaK-like protein
MQNINIEVIGVSPYNKGALLMLEAIRARLAEDLPNARLAVPMNWPTHMRLAHGLYGTYPREKGSRDLSFMGEVLPKGFRHNVGFFSASDVDVVLDASGFGYGDYWGLRKLKRRLTVLATRWKTPQKTLIVLPQALGPFKEAGMADAFTKVLKAADLVYVRDNVSMQYVTELAPGRSNVRLSPDFTNLLHPELPERLAHLRGYALIIPNEKVVGDDQAKRRTYIDFLQLAVEKLRATGKNVALLVHEGKGDKALAAELNAVLGAPLEVVDEGSPLITKAVIGQAYVTVSSRFHGLISAVSSGVPSVACGWTHKYAEVMSDYGCPELNLTLGDRSTWEPTLDKLVASAADPAMRQSLAAAAHMQRSKSSEMWSEVIGLIKQRHGSPGNVKPSQAREVPA